MNSEKIDSLAEAVPAEVGLKEACTAEARPAEIGLKEACTAEAVPAGAAGECMSEGCPAERTAFRDPGNNYKENIEINTEIKNTVCQGGLSS